MKKVDFPSETEKLELSALSSAENNIYCRSTGILQAVNNEGFTHLADPVFADILLFSGTRKAINSSIAPHQEHRAEITAIILKKVEGRYSLEFLLILFLFLIEL